jgi:hypothetical protein
MCLGDFITSFRVMCNVPYLQFVFVNLFMGILDLQSNVGHGVSHADSSSTAQQWEDTRSPVRNATRTPDPDPPRGTHWAPGWPENRRAQPFCSLTNSKRVARSHKAVDVKTEAKELCGNSLLNRATGNAPREHVIADQCCFETDSVDRT